MGTTNSRMEGKQTHIEGDSDPAVDRAPISVKRRDVRSLIFRRMTSLGIVALVFCIVVIYFRDAKVETNYVQCAQAIMANLQAFYDRHQEIPWTLPMPEDFPNWVPGSHFHYVFQAATGLL